MEINNKRISKYEENENIIDLGTGLVNRHWVERLVDQLKVTFIILEHLSSNPIDYEALSGIESVSGYLDFGYGWSMLGSVKIETMILSESKKRIISLTFTADTPSEKAMNIGSPDLDSVVRFWFKVDHRSVSSIEGPLYYGGWYPTEKDLMLWLSIYINNIPIDIWKIVYEYHAPTKDGLYLATPTGDLCSNYSCHNGVKSGKLFRFNSTMIIDRRTGCYDGSLLLRTDGLEWIGKDFPENVWVVQYSEINKIACWVFGPGFQESGAPYGFIQKMGGIASDYGVGLHKLIYPVKIFPSSFPTPLIRDELRRLKVKDLLYAEYKCTDNDSVSSLMEVLECNGPMLKIKAIDEFLSQWVSWVHIYDQNFRPQYPHPSSFAPMSLSTSTSSSSSSSSPSFSIFSPIPFPDS